MIILIRKQIFILIQKKQKIINQMSKNNKREYTRHML